MKLIGKIPIEPLDDERLTNIERRIVASAAGAVPARTPRRFVGFAAAASAVMVAGVIGWKLGGTAVPAPVVSAVVPIMVNTDARRSTLDIGDAAIQSDAATVFAVTHPAGGVLVTLTRGRVELEVGKRGDRAPLVVRAGATDVIVVGTHFSVDYGDGTGDVDVRVTEGVVKVVHHQQEIRVATGQGWKTQHGLLALADLRASEAGEPPGLAGRAPSGGGIGGGSEGDEPVASMDDPARTRHGDYEITTGTGPDVLHGRTTQVPDPRAPATTPPAVRPEGPTPSRPPHTVADPRDPKRDLKKLIAAQPVMSAMEIGATDAKAIAPYYDVIRKEDGEREARAFYSIAVIQHVRLGRDADALKTLASFFQRFSRGKVYPELMAARWLNVRILCLRAIDAPCRQAAATYARQATDGPAANVAHRIALAD